MAEDFGPEVFAGASSRDFLEKKKDWLVRLGGEGEGLVVVRLPIDEADFGRGSFLRAASHQREKE